MMQRIRCHDQAADVSNEACDCRLRTGGVCERWATVGRAQSLRCDYICRPYHVCPNDDHVCSHDDFGADDLHADDDLFSGHHQCVKSLHADDDQFASYDQRLQVLHADDDVGSTDYLFPAPRVPDMAARDDLRPAYDVGACHDFGPSHDLRSCLHEVMVTNGLF
jgi:hypothetical protein